MSGQQYAYYASGHKHKHYTGAASKYEILEELENGAKGFFIKVFFVNDKVNLNKWRITWDGIKQDIGDVVGVPIVKQDDMRHPHFTVQNLFAKGYIVDYALDEEKHEVQVIARILDAQTIKEIREGKMKFVSPAVVARDSLSLEEVDGVDVLTRWIALHLALVADPAYGTDAKITGTCNGMGHSCTLQLKKLAKPMLTELVANKTDDCISNKIPIIMSESPSMEHEQAVAIAISMCKKDSDADKKAENIPGSDSQNMDPLTQTPLLKKLMASTARIKSEYDQMVRQAGMPEHEGKWGFWVNIQDQDVFVSNGQTLEAAVKEQCGCALLAAINQKQLDIGTKIEMEHTKNKDVARQIALDHLNEDPEYYIKLLTHVEPENKHLLE